MLQWDPHIESSDVNSARTTGIYTKRTVTTGILSYTVVGLMRLREPWEDIHVAGKDDT